MKKKGLNIVISSFFNNDKFFERAFAISGLFIANMINSKVEDIYQNIIKNIWMFDIGFNIYIYNSLKGFIKIRNSNKIIKIKATFFII